MNEMVQRPYSSPRLQVNSPSNKRRRTFVDYGYRSILPKAGDSNTSSLVHERDGITAVMLQGVDQQANYPQTVQVNNTFTGSGDLAPSFSDYSSHPQKSSVSAHPQTCYPSPYPQRPPTDTPCANDRWVHAREYRRKVHEPPQVNPHDDPTIAEVEQNAELWVSELVTAMANTESVKDTETSHARRMFLSDNLNPLLIEATSREIFTSLIDRCKYGFRGPTSFNKALKPHKDSESDKTALCRERMENVVDVLAVNKRVCKDVLYEDWKIRLFVNHPLAYDKEKDSQKGSNDQRRLRLEVEREKLRQTEEELRIVREAGLLQPEQEAVSQHDGSVAGGKHQRIVEGEGTGLERRWV